MTKQRLFWLMAGSLLVALAVLGLSGSAYAFPNRQDTPTPTPTSENPAGDATDAAADATDPADADETATQPTEYVWDEFGVTLMLPPGWQAFPSSSFNLVLLPPDVEEQYVNDVFIGFTNVNYLGAGATPASVLQEQLGVEPEPYSAGELEGAYGIIDGPESDTVQKPILLLYSDHGGAFFIVASGLPDDIPVFDAVLDTLVVDIPTPDVAAIDAAWQSSLAAGDGLVYGEPDAPLAMVEYFSFLCGHCTNYSYDIERLIALEVEPGNLRLELDIMILYGSEGELLSSHATYCATEQGRGYSTYKALFQASTEQGQSVAFSADGIQSIISQPDLGLDVDAMNECIESGRYTDRLDQTRERFVTQGLTGTPSVLMAEGQDPYRRLMFPDGNELRGAVPVSALREIVRLVLNEETTLAEMFPGVQAPPPAAVEE
ncbi:MAG: thioredoxin domain-containing protein [Chloroflexi bacterium]|nr:thioredoxin domain-containing protein [Chloroflexota bacterium]